MDDIAKEMRILDSNLEYFGYSKLQAMENAGAGIAREITKRFGSKKRIAIFCGLGNNGGDGFAAARYLSKSNKVSVFLTGRASEIKTNEAKENFGRLPRKNMHFLEIKNQSCLKLIKGDFDIVLDCILGVGAEPPLREPLLSAVKKTNSMKGKKIAADIATHGFKSELTISLHVAKVKGAAVIDVGIPREFESRVGPGDVLSLFSPKAESHKGENGKVLIIAGSEQYYGAAILACKAASRFVDIVYFSSISENNSLIRKLKLETSDVIIIDRSTLSEFLKKKKVDSILIGPGMGISEGTKRLTELVLRSKIPCVLDADSLKVINPKLLHKNCIVTPHAREFELLFGGKGADEKRVSEMAKKYNCTILRKGPTDVISDGKRTKLNFTHNVGMTKGGTGDVLAGLTVALLSKNEPFESACSAAFINGFAGDLLQNEKGTHFSASDLCDALPIAAKRIEDYGRRA